MGWAVVRKRSTEGARERPFGFSHVEAVWTQADTCASDKLTPYPKVSFVKDPPDVRTIHGVIHCHFRATLASEWQS
jgi:hypothetical protein